MKTTHKIYVAVALLALCAVAYAAIDAVTTGGNTRQIFVIGDPSTASNIANVGQYHNSDTNAIGSAFYSLLGTNVPLLLNSAGTYDRQRSAVGTVGTAAVSTEGNKTTYSVGALGVTPAATATDFFQILGSATKTVRILYVRVTGIASSAAVNDVQGILRTAANSGGTVSAKTVQAHDSNDAAPTAVANVYTANPASLGSGNPVRIEKINLGAAATAASSVPVTWDFTTRNGKGIVLRGVAQSFDLNWNGAAVPAGTALDIEVEFTEE